MGKRNREHLVQIRKGVVVPYRIYALSQRLTNALVAARKEFGDEQMNKILLGFMSPEVGH